MERIKALNQSLTELTIECDTIPDKTTEVNNYLDTFCINVEIIDFQQVQDINQQYSRALQAKRNGQYDIAAKELEKILQIDEIVQVVEFYRWKCPFHWISIK